jgi:hypothetical protein
MKQETSLLHLADELLLLVAALPVINSNDQKSPLSVRQSPFNVSQVCRKMRLVALSSPQLWSRVNYDIRMYDEFKQAAREGAL